MDIEQICQKFNIKTGPTFGKPGIDPSISLVGKNHEIVVVELIPNAENNWRGELKAPLTQYQLSKLGINTDTLKHE